MYFNVPPRKPKATAVLGIFPMELAVPPLASTFATSVPALMSVAAEVPLPQLPPVFKVNEPVPALSSHESAFITIALPNTTSLVPVSSVAKPLLPAPLYRLEMSSRLPGAQIRPIGGREFGAIWIVPAVPKELLENCKKPALKKTPPVKLFVPDTHQVLAPDLLRVTLPVPLSVRVPEKIFVPVLFAPTKFKVRATLVIS